MQLRPILSVGIDVGTTSTHLTFSRLHLANVSRPTEPSRMVVSQREIVYQSQIHFTPLDSESVIDAAAVEKIVTSEYSNAGFGAHDIDTGAVIITGETAKKRNAEEIVHRLSQMAGQFVVASAGPNLESILSARGSGAAAASRDELATICNIDIGGGTSNFAVFKDGHPIATACLNVGGRFVQVAADMQVIAISESGKHISERALGRVVSIGERISLESAQRMAAYAAQLIIDVLKNTNLDAVHAALLMTPPLTSDYAFDQIWLSGGVSETIRARKDHQRDSVLYGDLGSMIGRALEQLLVDRKIKYVVPPQPIRATVIGAGTHSLQLSGSTVAVTDAALPATNIPVIRPLENCTVDSELRDLNQFLEQRVRNCLAAHDLDWTQQPVAVFLPELSRIGYSQLQSWSGALANTFKNLEGTEPLVLVCTNDVAAALGQQMRKLLPSTSLIVLDGIYNAGGDFIDIGKPIANKQAIPVILKDLIFVR